MDFLLQQVAIVVAFAEWFSHPFFLSSPSCALFIALRLHYTRITIKQVSFNKKTEKRNQAQEEVDEQLQSLAGLALFDGILQFLEHEIFNFFPAQRRGGASSGFK